MPARSQAAGLPVFTGENQQIRLTTGSNCVALCKSFVKRPPARIIVAIGMVLLLGLFLAIAWCGLVGNHRCHRPNWPMAVFCT